MSQGCVPAKTGDKSSQDLAPQGRYANDCFLADGTLEMHEEDCTLQDPCRLFSASFVFNFLMFFRTFCVGLVQGTPAGLNKAMASNMRIYILLPCPLFQSHDSLVLVYKCIEQYSLDLVVLSESESKIQ